MKRKELKLTDLGYYIHQKKPRIAFVAYYLVHTNSTTQSSFVTSTGINKWKEKDKLISHERSPNL